MTATCFPTFEHGKIVILFDPLSSEAWPIEAVAVSGVLPFEWLRDNWKPQAGREWNMVDERHYVVTP